MTVNMLKSKIHRATVKQAELQYVGSITIDEALMEAAGIFEYEKVQIVDIENGNRFETYVIALRVWMGQIHRYQRRVRRNEVLRCFCTRQSAL